MNYQKETEKFIEEIKSQYENGERKLPWVGNAEPQNDKPRKNSSCIQVVAQILFILLLLLIANNALFN